MSHVPGVSYGTDMNESRHMSFISYISTNHVIKGLCTGCEVCTNESCHTHGFRHSESCHINEQNKSQRTWARATQSARTSHVTNESCHERVMSHLCLTAQIWINHVTRVRCNGRCNGRCKQATTHMWIMSQMRTSPVTNGACTFSTLSTNESRHMSHSSYV